MLVTPYRYVPVVTPIYRVAKRHLNLLRYSGADLYCPVCGHGWSKPKPSTECPFCGSLTRQKALALWLESHLADVDRIVETLLFAPDFGLEMWLKRRDEIALSTTDYSAPGVDFHADITALPLGDESFDLVLCSHVLEHVQDDAAALAELRRILRPDGVAIIQVPYDRRKPETDEDPSVVDPDERQRRFGQFDHVRRYGRDLVDRISAQGLEAEVLTVDNFVSQNEMEQYELWNDTLFVCRPANRHRPL